MRLPVTTDLRTRLGNSTKDSRLVNATVEKKSDGMNVRKRPGMISTGYNFTSTQVLGFLLDKLALIHDDILEIGTPVVIGTLVDGYYAMIDNPPTSPGPGDAYWSLTAPGTTRWKSAILFKEFLVLGDVHITMTVSSTSPWISSQIQGPIAASKAATYKKLLEDVIAADGVIAWNYDDIGCPPWGTAYRVIPLNIDTTYDSTTNFYRRSATVNWTAGYVPSSIAAPTVLAGYPAEVAIWGTKKTKSVIITSSGSVASISFSEFDPGYLFYYGVQLLYLVRWIKVSDSSDTEYNGTFEWNLSTNPLDDYATVITDRRLYYTMTGTPSSAITTATVEYYF
jgi:hypothetical protein